MATRKIILIRHGETPKNTHGVMHVADDVDTLTELGIQQMQRTAQNIRDEHVQKVYCSTEERSKQSAEIIAAGLSLAVETLDGFE